MKKQIYTLTLAIAFSAIAHAELGFETQSVRYRVPVKNSKLKKYAEFKIDRVEQLDSNGQTQVRYTLPLELTGAPNEVIFSGNYKEGSANTSLSGVNGAMMCSEGLTKICNVQFVDLKINEQARLNILKGMSHSAVELRGRLAVARSFSGDPGGVMIYSRKNSNY